MASTVYDNYTQISSITELEEIKRKKREQEEADREFLLQDKKNRALFGMGRQTGRNVGTAAKLAEFVGYKETEYELTEEVIDNAVGESVADLNRYATGDTKTAPAAPTADITAFKSDMGSDTAMKDIEAQETLVVADRYFENNGVADKAGRAKWINENKIDFLKKVFPNRWNDIQDNEAKQRYITKMEADKMRVAELEDDYRWWEEGIDWLKVPENAALLGTEIAATVAPTGGVTLPAMVLRRMVYDGAIAASFEGVQAKQRVDTGISTTGEAIADTAIVGGFGAGIGGGAEFILNSKGLRGRMSKAANWLFNNEKKIKAQTKADEAAEKQRVASENVDEVVDDVPGEVPNAVEVVDEAGKKKLTQKQVAAIKVKEKLRAKRAEKKQVKAERVKAADENKAKVSSAVQCLLNL